MLRLIKYTCLMALVTAGFEVLAQPSGESAAKPADRSVFTMPSNPQEGRDPFFPESTRPYTSSKPSQVAPIVTTLTVKGFSGTSENRMVIINNHSFGIGDDGDVLTSGGRVHLRCIEITDHSVTIEVNNQRRVLSF